MPPQRKKSAVFVKTKAANFDFLSGEVEVSLLCATFIKLKIWPILRVVRNLKFASNMCVMLAS